MKFLVSISSEHSRLRDNKHKKCEISCDEENYIDLYSFGEFLLNEFFQSSPCCKITITRIDTINNDGSIATKEQIESHGIEDILEMRGAIFGYLHGFCDRGRLCPFTVL